MTSVSHLPYPRADRALHQLDRHAYERCPIAPAADQFRATIARAFRVPPRLIGMHAGEVHIEHPRRTGKAAIVRAIVDQAKADGEHVHSAGPGGMRCHGGDPDCTTPRAEESPDDGYCTLGEALTGRGDGKVVR